MSIILGTGIVVKMVLMVLIGFSVVSWTIIMFKFYQVQRANSESVRFMDLFWEVEEI